MAHLCPTQPGTRDVDEERNAGAAGGGGGDEWRRAQQKARATPPHRCLSLTPLKSISFIKREGGLSRRKSWQMQDVL